MARRLKNPGSQTGERVLLAPVRYGDSLQPAYVDDQGRAWVNGDWWSAVRYAGQIAAVIGPPAGCSRDAVLIKLNLCGYWPTAAALRGYLNGAA